MDRIACDYELFIISLQSGLKRINQRIIENNWALIPALTAALKQFTRTETDFHSYSVCAVIFLSQNTCKEGLVKDWIIPIVWCYLYSKVPNSKSVFLHRYWKEMTICILNFILDEYELSDKLWFKISVVSSNRNWTRNSCFAVG